MPTPVHVDQRQHLRGPVYLELSVLILFKLRMVSLFIMEKQILMPAVLHYIRTVFLLLLVTCSSPLVRSSLAASNALNNLDDFTYTYGSIFSPLLKALSEHAGSRWNTGLKRKMKPEHRYIKYLTEVQRSLDGNRIYNTVRLIKPQDECLAQSNKGEQVGLKQLRILTSYTKI